MKAPDESSIMKDFPENATEWIASCGKRCTDELKRATNMSERRPKLGMNKLFGNLGDENDTLSIYVSRFGLSSIIWKQKLL